MDNVSKEREVVSAYLICEFVSCCRQLLPYIKESLRESDVDGLPPSVVSFLSQRLVVPSKEIQNLWGRYEEVISSSEVDHINRLGGRADATSEDVLRLQSLGLPAISLSLPFSTCPDSCCGRQLVYKPPIKGLLYTIARGVLPLLCPSLYCNGCKTRFYHNYSVKSASDSLSLRSYYQPGVPEAIEITDHIFVDVGFCEWVRSEMALNSSSATGILSVYCTSIGKSTLSSCGGPYLSPALVLECFFMFSLLLQSDLDGHSLHLPHHGEQPLRLMDALNERNRRIAGTGLQHWAHRCDGCHVVVKDPSQREVTISAAVTDGLTMGHPCCNEHDCKEPLRKVFDEFCPTHQFLGVLCCIECCSSPREIGFRTCENPLHRSEEKRRSDTASQRASRRRVRGSGGISYLKDAADDASRPRGRRKSGQGVKGVFSRRWTHNEQLMVRPCGVIIGRATFYSSESNSGVSAFIDSIFPHSLPGSLPDFLFFDNACGLRKYISKRVDSRRLACLAVVVDAFHFSGHKVEDVECQVHCNPKSYPVLRREDGTWLFNSSAAEQVNSWFGKLQPKVKEMNVVRYNFFLDEVVHVRNQLRVNDLQMRGMNPRFSSDAELSTVRIHSTTSICPIPSTSIP